MCSNFKIKLIVKCARALNKHNRSRIGVHIENPNVYFNFARIPCVADIILMLTILLTISFRKTERKVKTEQERGREQNVCATCISSISLC